MRGRKRTEGRGGKGKGEEEEGEEEEGEEKEGREEEEEQRAGGRLKREKRSSSCLHEVL